MNGFSRQRGAIGLLAILTLLLAILFTAVAVDTGRLMLIQRQLQTVADMAALDASHVTGHCKATENNLADIALVANTTANRNGYSGQPLVVQLGVLTTDAQGVRQFETEPDDVSTAVKVVASKSVPASLFAGGIWGHQVNLQAEAVAERQAIAGFSAGTTLASISTQQSQLLNLLLGDILGSEVNLNAVSYNGMADLDLRLIDLVNASSDIGTVDELLNTDLSVGQLLNLYVDAVSALETANVQALAGLEQLVGANVSGLTVTLADVINVTTQSPQMAANAAVNLFQLLTTSLMVANGENALNIDVGDTLLPINAKLAVIEPPQIAIGPPGQDDNETWRTQMQTAQIRLAITVTPDLNLGLVRAAVDLGLTIDIAQGTAWLQTIQCSTHANNQTVVTIGAKPGIASLNVTQANGSGSVGRIEVRALFGILPVARIDVGLRLPVENTDDVELEYSVNLSDSDALPMIKTSGSSGSSLNFRDKVEVTLTPTVLGVLPLPLGGLLELLLGDVLGPILGAIGTQLLDPLLELLSMDIGVINVELMTVDIDRPELKR